jgi:hypothetical protein
MVQWVTDSEAEPLKGVEGGYTHQPWTNPWFFEYPSNYSSFPHGLRAGMPYNKDPVYFKGTRDDMAFAIRGYTFELRMLRKAFEKHDGWYFRDHAFNATTGAVVDFDMLGPWETLDGKSSYNDDYWPYVTAITNDGRALKRKLSLGVHGVSNGKQVYDLLDAHDKPIFDEMKEPIKIVYDTKTGLAETRYGRALVPLDKHMGGL